MWSNEIWWCQKGVPHKQESKKSSRSKSKSAITGYNTIQNTQWSASSVYSLKCFLTKSDKMWHFWCKPLPNLAHIIWGNKHDRDITNFTWQKTSGI